MFFVLDSTDAPSPNRPRQVNFSFSFWHTLSSNKGSMVVRVGGSFAYLAGDGMLTFDDHVRTVGDLRSAIEKTTNIPGIKQVDFLSSLPTLIHSSIPDEKQAAGSTTPAVRCQHHQCFTEIDTTCVIAAGQKGSVNRKSVPPHMMKRERRPHIISCPPPPQYGT